MEDAKEYQVEFDYKSAVRYTTCASCCIATSTFIGIFCIPCFCFCASKATRNQRCTVDDKRIHFTGGYWNKFDRVVPLDRIQDLNVSQDWIQNLCGTHVISIQTAGAGGGDGQAELTLVGPKNPQDVRGVFLARRDALVLGHGSAPSQNLTGGGLDSGVHPKIVSQPAEMSQMVVAKLDELNKTAARIEKQIERGLGSK